VTRLTVYNQFGSKTGLLEAVCDDIAERSRIAERLAAAFQLPGAEDCLDGIIVAFLEFWAGERTILRRLRSMAALDPTFRSATLRDERRVAAMRAALLRVAAERHRRLANADACARIVATLTSFETFDALAGPGADAAWVSSTVRQLVRAAVERALR
jgi:AcrR family transcriptional regulator